MDAEAGRGAGGALVMHRLHPATILTKSLQMIPQAAAGSAGFAAIIAREGLARVLLFALLGGLFAVGYMALAWWRFRYGIGAGEIVVEKGVLGRQRRVIPFDRIQDIAIERGPLARLFGAARVRIETGGSKEDEGDLDMIALGEAHAMRDILRRRARAEPADRTSGAAPGDEPRIFAMSLGRVLLAGLFNFSLVFLAILLGALQYVQVVTGLDLYDPDNWWVPAQAAAGISILMGAAIAALLLVLGVVSGVGRTLAKDYGFVLTRAEAGLRRRRGLLTLSEVVIPIRRTQVAAIDNGVLGRAFGWHRLSFQTLGADRREGGMQVAAPFARMAEILPILAEPGFPPPPARAAFRRAPRRAMVRRIAAPSVGATLLAFAGLVIHPYAGLGALLLGLIAVAGLLRWRRHHYAIGAQALFVTGGLFSRRLWIVPFEKLQTLDQVRSPFQRLLGLASLTVDTAGASALRAPAIVDLDQKDAERVAAQLLAAFRQARTQIRIRARGAAG